MSVDLQWKHVRVRMFFIIGWPGASQLTEMRLPKAESSVSAGLFGTL
ncbi:hypothetical protein [Mesorhizobium argentiipisi]|uniref:Uncharacterized protein n=1 Tax=Mesorhizobium argentiipisi TaxID=3015175 RepID=A0ABU8K4V5_9HYPH